MPQKKKFIPPDVIEYCDNRIAEFSRWYAKHYIYRYARFWSDLTVYAEMAEMPKSFRFEKLDLNCDEAKDFCVEFWNEGKDFMLFKLMDCLRIY